MADVAWVAGAVTAALPVYALSVGVAARVLARAWNVEAHDPEWRNKNNTMACGDFYWVTDTPVRCPGCRDRKTAWVCAWIWPLTLTWCIGYRTGIGIRNGITRLTAVAAPSVMTQGPEGVGDHQEEPRG